MRSILLCVCVSMAASAAFVVSCDGSSPEDVPTSDAGVAEVSVVPPSDGAPSSGEDGAAPDPVRAPFGLDQRPSNTTCAVPARPVLATGVKAVDAFPGLKFAAPMGILQAPNDPSRFYVMERSGAVRTFPANATAQAQVTDFVRLPAGLVNGDGEGGLLGMAFHPNWATNREVFLSYTGFSATAPNGSNMRSIVARYKSQDNGATLSTTADEILKFDQPYTNHNGGDIAFGPDGYLYIGFGDGGAGGDPLRNGQNKDVLFGKMLRIDVNGAAAGTYNIPPTNPFANGGGKKEIYAYGFRNPWRWSFDRATGDLWVGDVGQGLYEEIDRVELGGNYGWSTREGAHCYGPATCNTAGLIDPVVEHGRTEARSITGGYVYRGTAMPSLVGTYIYGDYETGNVWGIVYDGTGKPSSKLLFTLGVKLISSFGEGADGELYIASIAAGTIQKLVPAAAPPASTFPELLSKTGCVDPKDPTKPAPGLIPYEVNAPLWSDGAAKERYLALPDNKQITVGADGDWDLPIGSVLVKTFVLGATRVETRLFMRHADGGWAGYTYEWNDAQTDATLLPAGKTKTVGTAQWSFPSRSQCLQCHTPAAGGTLGLETAQMNREAIYPGTNRIADQLATLDHIGLFVAKPTSDAGALPAIPSPEGTGPLPERARAYLHANCSHCHRPGGGGQGTMDLRYAQPLGATNTCNKPQNEGHLGPADAKLLFPAAPAKSVVSLRMHATDANRMPPIASSVVDVAGAKLVDDWITSLTACP